MNFFGKQKVALEWVLANTLKNSTTLWEFSSSWNALSTLLNVIPADKTIYEILCELFRSSAGNDA